MLVIVSASLKNRRQLLPTSTEHWAVALANFSIGRTLPDIVAAILHRQETSQRVHLAFSRWLHMIRSDYVICTTSRERHHGHSPSDWPEDVQRMRIPPSSKNSWRTTLGFGANKASGAMASQQ